MKKIDLIPMVMQVNVSDAMVKDFRECKENAYKPDGEQKDCDTCSWNVIEFGNVGLCELMDEKQISGEGTQGW